MWHPPAIRRIRIYTSSPPRRPRRGCISGLGTATRPTRVVGWAHSSQAQQSGQSVYRLSPRSRAYGSAISSPLHNGKEATTRSAAESAVGSTSLRGSFIRFGKSFSSAARSPRSSSSGDSSPGLHRRVICAFRAHQPIRDARQLKSPPISRKTHLHNFA
jgi:hypothetical protein